MKITIRQSEINQMLRNTPGITGQQVMNDAIAKLVCTKAGYFEGTLRGTQGVELDIKPSDPPAVRQQLRDFDLNPRQVFNTIRIFPEKPVNAPWRWHFLNDFEIIQQVYEIEVDTIPDEPPLTLRDLLGKPPKR